MAAILEFFYVQNIVFTMYVDFIEIVFPIKEINFH